MEIVYTVCTRHIRVINTHSVIIRTENSVRVLMINRAQVNDPVVRMNDYLVNLNFSWNSPMDHIILHEAAN